MGAMSSALVAAGRPAPCRCGPAGPRSSTSRGRDSRTPPAAVGTPVTRDLQVGRAVGTLDVAIGATDGNCQHTSGFIVRGTTGATLVVAAHDRLHRQSQELRKCRRLARPLVSRASSSISVHRSAAACHSPGRAVAASPNPSVSTRRRRLDPRDVPVVHGVARRGATAIVRAVGADARTSGTEDAGSMRSTATTGRPGSAGQDLRDRRIRPRCGARVEGSPAQGPPTGDRGPTTVDPCAWVSSTSARTPSTSRRRRSRVAARGHCPRPRTRSRCAVGRTSRTTSHRRRRSQSGSRSSSTSASTSVRTRVSRS